MTLSAFSLLRFIHTKLLPVFAVILAVLGMLTMVVSAQSTSCDTAAQAGAKPNLGDLFQPAKFLPLVPNECALDSNGKAKPLSLNYFGYILLRLYYFLSSLVFFLFTLSVLFFGIQWIMVGITNDGNTYAIQKSIKNAVFGLFMVAGAYLVVSTIAQLLGISDFLSKPLTSGNDGKAFFN